MASARIGRRAALAGLAAACARREATLEAVNGAPGATVHLAAFMLHTEVLFDWPLEEALPPPFPPPGFLGVSFGSRDYFAADFAGPVELLRAFVPGPSAILVAPRRAVHWDAVALRVPADGPVRLARAVAADIARDAVGRPILVAPGPSPGSVFLEGVPAYSLAYTCNTWTLDTLAAAGVPVSGAGIITPRMAMLAARLAAGH